MTPRIGPLPRAIALVPLAALSAAWTVQVVQTPAVDVTTVASEDPPIAGTPSPTSAPAPTPAQTPLVVPPVTQAPASVWGDSARPAAPPAVAPAAATSSSIPTVALAAYQRAAAVMDTADPSCHLDWSLIAGIGRVESDHGSHAGSQLAPDGHATPAIVGPALTGAAGTLLVPDTDGGALDGDAQYDHAVGPMQFLPATWSNVGVDGDGDGKRDPQDIDDAALAAGVYLCSGGEDLATSAGQQAALLRYNESTSYVATVLTFAHDYGAVTGAPAGVTAVRSLAVVPGVLLTPETGSTGTAGSAGSPGSAGGKARKGHRHGSHAAIETPAAAAGGGHPAGHAVPSTVPELTGPTKGPSDGGTTPVPATPEQLGGLCGDGIDKEYPAITEDLRNRAVDECVRQLTGKTLDQAKDGVDAVVKDLPQTVDGLEPQPTPTPTGDPSPSATQEPETDPSATASTPAG